MNNVQHEVQLFSTTGLSRENLEPRREIPFSSKSVRSNKIEWNLEKEKKKKRRGKKKKKKEPEHRTLSVQYLHEADSNREIRAILL